MADLLPRSELDYRTPAGPPPVRWSIASFVLAVIGCGLPLLALPAVSERVVRSPINSPLRWAALGYDAVALLSLLCGQWCGSVAVRRTRADLRVALAGYWLNSVLIVLAAAAFELVSGAASSRLHVGRLAIVAGLAVATVLCRPRRR